MVPIFWTGSQKVAVICPTYLLLHRLRISFQAIRHYLLGPTMSFQGHLQEGQRCGFAMLFGDTGFLPPACVIDRSPQVMPLTVDRRISSFNHLIRLKNSARNSSLTTPIRAA